MTELNCIKSFHIGVTYAESMQMQQEAYFNVLNVESLGSVLGFSYDGVVTLGKTAKLEDETFLSLGDFEKRGFEIGKTDRGGKATLHTKGQLVIYPIISLKRYDFSVRSYVSYLENVTIEFLKELGINSFKTGESGVFTNNGKIAFVGIRVLRGISQHGISINFENDLSLFNLIRPCGLDTRPMDSVRNYESQISLSDGFDLWCRIFENQKNWDT